MKPKKQSTRLIKVECPCCGYVARVTRKWLKEGRPKCPKGETMLAVWPEE